MTLAAIVMVTHINCCQEKLTSTAHFCCCNLEGIWATLHVPASTLPRQYSTWEYVYDINMNLPKVLNKNVGDSGQLGVK
jgi:hypothetical protein